MYFYAKMTTRRAHHCTSAFRTSSKRKGVRDQAGLLAFVTGQRAYRRAGASFATGVRNLGAEKCSQPRLDESPRSHVFGFFLTPDELRVLCKRLEHFAQFLFRERIELLDANDHRIVNLAIASVLEQIVINLARAKDDALYVVDRTGFRRAENFFEAAVDEFFRWR